VAHGTRAAIRRPAGFTGTAGIAAWIAKVLFVLLLILAVIAIFSGEPAEQRDGLFSRQRGKPLE